MPGLPCDPFAEMEFLGTVLGNPSHMIEVTGSNLVTVDDIHSPEHYLIWKAINQLDGIGETASPTAVASWLHARNELESAGGLSYIDSLTTYAGSLQSSANRIVRKATRRKLLYFGAMVSSKAQEESIDEEDMLDELEAEFYSIRRRRGVEVTRIGNMLNAWKTNFDRTLTGDLSFMTRTKIPVLDSVLGPLMRNDVVLLGGRPGDGKSSLLKWMAWNTAVAPGPEGWRGVYIGDYEEGEIMFAMKMVGIQTGIDTELLKNPAMLSPEQLEAVDGALTALANAPLYVESMAAPTVTQYKARVRDAKRQCEREFGVELEFHAPDYMQLLRGQGESSVSQATDVSREIRAMCMPGHNALNTPCFATAQLNRAPIGQNGQPRDYEVSDLRESGALEQDATVIVFPSRKWVLNPPGGAIIRSLQENVQDDGNQAQKWRAEPIRWNVRKNRGGSTGSTAPILWSKYCGRYQEDERVNAFYE